MAAGSPKQKARANRWAAIAMLEKQGSAAFHGYR